LTGYMTAAIFLIARTGVPVTLATLAICAASLWWRILPAA